MLASNMLTRKTEDCPLRNMSASIVMCLPTSSVLPVSHFKDSILCLYFMPQ